MFKVQNVIFTTYRKEWYMNINVHQQNGENFINDKSSGRRVSMCLGFDVYVDKIVLLVTKAWVILGSTLVWINSSKCSQSGESC